VLSIEGRTLLESSDDISKLIFTSMSGSNWKGCCRFSTATGAAKNPFHENLKKYRRKYCAVTRKKIFPKIKFFQSSIFDPNPIFYYTETNDISRYQFKSI
jgi:hypothetical protein